MRIAVAGGTGLVGRKVMVAAESAGHEAVALSRSTGVDLTTGAGLRDALAGVEAVIDVSNVVALRREAAVRFFETATSSLLTVETEAGVRHHVALSIVGVDRVPSGYYQGKVRQEEVIAAGAVPWTVLRATQFHEFAEQMIGHAVGPLVPVPRMRSATVAAREVAEELVRLAAASAAGRTPDLSGPEVNWMPDLVRRLLRVQGRRGIVVAIPVPGATGRAMAGGSLLPIAGGTVGRETFAEWLAGVSA